MRSKQLAIPIVIHHIQKLQHVNTLLAICSAGHAQCVNFQTPMVRFLWFCKYQLCKLINFCRDIIFIISTNFSLPSKCLSTSTGIIHACSLYLINILAANYSVSFKLGLKCELNFKAHGQDIVYNSEKKNLHARRIDDTTIIYLVLFSSQIRACIECLANKLRPGTVQLHFSVNMLCYRQLSKVLLSCCH